MIPLNMINEFIYSKTQHEKPLLIHNDYLYTLHEEENGIKKWRCQIRDCKERLHVNGSEIVEFTAHRHLGDNIKIKSHLKKQEIKSGANNIYERTSDIVFNVLKTIDKDTILF
ncbi:hypothetical protein DMUE_3819 [Dictyocoela muelleri]|nr:hypothetical protein DMUE_3819 [Dictyocoela muelleri]